MVSISILTKKEQIQNVAKKWRHQYPVGSYNATSDKMLIAYLLETEPNLTKERVDEIIGNDSWTKLICSNCEEDVEAVAFLGGESDYEYETVCLACLEAAITAIKEAL